MRLSTSFHRLEKSDAAKGGGYPQLRYQEQRIELWSLEQTDAYLDERLSDFAFALGCLPECTPEELWQDPAKWAVYRKAGQSRACRILETEDEAQKLADEIGGVVEYRPAKAKRCNYCTAEPFCEQYNQLKAAGLVDGD